MNDFEKLGLFYLGRGYDLETKKRTEDLILYDSKDLVTHAVCIGMTGSGKTGLCIGILEEAAIDGIPAIVIDPKGDLANLMLTFPDLRPEDFRPWINEEDARKRGLSPEDYAAQQAELWRKGLADWGQDAERIQRLRAAADFAVYTPGSNAGLPVSVMKSFQAPDRTLLEDTELFNERISTTATSLLSLLGIEADPIQTREHILLSTIIGAAWKQGQNLDLGALIQQIQTPPVSRIGVLDVESFFPSKERFAFAMRINNLLAAPGFELWMEGEPLNINQFLYTPKGKPRISIFSIAHLSDAERMFFVSMLLTEIVSWMRTQSGTSSLRTIMYMDEVFGYFPPVANPPSKLPLLTLLKQARAFGVGIILATQNPVDLDYKGLANTGTWFIGRLQTERDKARVLDGLEGASSHTGMNFNRQDLERILGGLSSRIFLMNNVHEDGPVVMETRWALSYLRGPMTRNQIKMLNASAGSTHKESVVTESTPSSKPQDQSVSNRNTAQPVLPPEVPQFFLPPDAGAPGGRLFYKPRLLGTAKIYYADSKAEVAMEHDVSFLAEIPKQAVSVNWPGAGATDVKESDLEKVPREGASYEELSEAAFNAKNYEDWEREFTEWLFRNQKIELFKSPSLKGVSKPGESERDFRIRLQQDFREQRDQMLDQLRQKYTSRIAALEEKIRKAGQAIEREEEQARTQKTQTAISIGTTILGAILGRKRFSTSTLGRATTAARGVSRASKEAQDIERAKEASEAYQKQLTDLHAQLKLESDALLTKLDPQSETFEKIELRPKKTNISVRILALVWIPYTS